MKLNSPYLLFEKKNILFWMCFPALYLLSLIYFFTVCILKFAYKAAILPTYRPKYKVISVGNITLGGTGKTPLVEFITDYFLRNQKKPGIIIRGYKRTKSKESGIIKKDSVYLETGDEAGMLKDNFSEINISIGRDKVKSARQLEKEKCDVVVLDDGFQHWRLARDLDVVTIDCSFPVSSHRLLPLGRLREPLNSLKRADIFVLTKTDFNEDNLGNLRKWLSEINPNALIVDSIYEPVYFCDLKTGATISIDSGSFLDAPILMLAGIANPLYFDRVLSKLKLKIKRELIYPDHYEYKKSDLDFINKLARVVSVDTIVTTHKDAVRLRQFSNLFKNINIFYLKIKLKITRNDEEFAKRLLSVLNS